MACHGMDMVWHGMTRKGYGMAWHGRVGYGMAWHGMVWVWHRMHMVGAGYGRVGAG